MAYDGDSFQRAERVPTVFEALVAAFEQCLFGDCIDVYATTDEEHNEQVRDLSSFRYWLVWLRRASASEVMLKTTLAVVALTASSAFAATSSMLAFSIFMTVDLLKAYPVVAWLLLTCSLTVNFLMSVKDLHNVLCHIFLDESPFATILQKSLDSRRQADLSLMGGLSVSDDVVRRYQYILLGLSPFAVSFGSVIGFIAYKKLSAAIASATLFLPITWVPYLALIAASVLTVKLMNTFVLLMPEVYYYNVFCREHGLRGWLPPLLPVLVFGLMSLSAFSIGCSGYRSAVDAFADCGWVGGFANTFALVGVAVMGTLGRFAFCTEGLLTMFGYIGPSPSAKTQTSSSVRFGARVVTVLNAFATSLNSIAILGPGVFNSLGTGFVGLIYMLGGAIGSLATGEIAINRLRSMLPSSSAPPSTPLVAPMWDNRRAGEKPPKAGERELVPSIFPPAPKPSPV